MKMGKILALTAVAALALTGGALAGTSTTVVKNGITLSGNLYVTAGAQPTAYAKTTASVPVTSISVSLAGTNADGTMVFAPGANGSKAASVTSGTIALKSNAPYSIFYAYHQVSDTRTGWWGGNTDYMF